MPAEVPPFRSSIMDRLPFSRSQRTEMLNTLTSCLKKAEGGRLRLKIPRIEGRMQKRPEMHYHFKPEIFIQLGGSTQFDCPKEKVQLMPSEVGIMPSGVPHHETVFSNETSFKNVVIGFYSNAISVHFAFEIEKGRPEIDVIEFYEAPNLDFFLSLTNGLVEAFHKNAPASDHLAKGLAISLFALLVNLVESGNQHLNQDIGKVFQTKWLVREQISNSELNVKSLAKMIRCSPDYLSHLFHEQTGEKLIHYVQRMRIEGAMLALTSSPLYISEIAWASGFSDAAYFARVFKRFAGISPQAFRNQQDKKHRQKEIDPKTIYYDHVDYSAGHGHVS